MSVCFKAKSHKSQWSDFYYKDLHTTGWNNAIEFHTYKVAIARDVKRQR